MAPFILYLFVIQVMIRHSVSVPMAAPLLQYDQVLAIYNPKKCGCARFIIGSIIQASVRGWLSDVDE